MTNESIMTFILALHTTAIGALRPDTNIEIFEDETQDRRRVVVKQGASQMITYYDGYSRSMPYRTVVKRAGKIVFSKMGDADPRTDKLAMNQSVALTETLSNPGNSFTISGAMIRLR